MEDPEEKETGDKGDGCITGTVGYVSGETGRVSKHSK